MAEVPSPPDAVPPVPPESAPDIDSLPPPPPGRAPEGAPDRILPPPPEAEPAPDAEPDVPTDPDDDTNEDEGPSWEELFRQAELARARAEGRASGLESVIPSLTDVAKTATASAGTRDEGRGGVDAVDPIARQQALQERNEVKGKAEWERMDPSEERHWQSAASNYTRDKEDLRADGFGNQLKDEIDALRNVARQLTRDRSTIPNLDPLQSIDTASGKQTTIAVTTPESGSELSDADARDLAIDLIDALAQRAGEAFTLQSLERLDEGAAKERWSECAEAAGYLFEHVLYPVGDQAREEYNAKNAHLRDRERDPLITKTEYRNKMVMFTRNKFFTLARGMYGNKALKLTEAYDQVNLEADNPNYRKLKKQKDKAGVAPRSVAKITKPAPLEYDEEAKKYSWDHMSKLRYIGTTAVCGVSGLLTATTGRLEVGAWGLGAGAAVFGIHRTQQAVRTRLRQDMALEWKERAHVVNNFETSGESSAEQAYPASTSLSEQVRPKYPKPIKPFSDTKVKEAFTPVIHLRAAQGLSALAVGVMLLGSAASVPEEEAGARTGEMDEVDDFNTEDRVPPAEIENDNPGFYESDTQLTDEELEEVERLMDEENLTFPQALDALDNGS